MSLRRRFKTEAGQGGRRGHSNMSRYDYTEILKSMSKKLRRRNARAEIDEQRRDTP